MMMEDADEFVPRQHPTEDVIFSCHDPPVFDFGHARLPLPPTDDSNSKPLKIVVDAECGKASLFVMADPQQDKPRDVVPKPPCRKEREVSSAGVHKRRCGGWFRILAAS
jgi:hypothetical protein